MECHWENRRKDETLEKNCTKSTGRSIELCDELVMCGWKSTGVHVQTLELRTGLKGNIVYLRCISSWILFFTVFTTFANYTIIQLLILYIHFLVIKSSEATHTNTIWSAETSYLWFIVLQSGLTPFHLAAQEEQVGVAELLLKHGADIDVQTKVRSHFLQWYSEHKCMIIYHEYICISLLRFCFFVQSDGLHTTACGLSLWQH